MAVHRSFLVCISSLGHGSGHFLLVWMRILYKVTLFFLFSSILLVSSLIDYLLLCIWVCNHLITPEILSAFRKATHCAPKWGKAWHKWALFNTAVMSHYTLRGFPSLAAQFVVAAVTGYFHSIACAAHAKGVDDSLQVIINSVLKSFFFKFCSLSCLSPYPIFLHLKDTVFETGLCSATGFVHPTPN